MSESINIEKITTSLSSEDFIFLNDILKKENSESILANLSKDLLSKYFQILIDSKNIFTIMHNEKCALDIKCRINK